MDQKKARAIADRCHKVNTRSEFDRSSHFSLSFLGLVLCQQSYKITRHFPSFSIFQTTPPAWSRLPYISNIVKLLLSKKYSSHPSTTQDVLLAYQA
ncbi:hypothetical protein G6F57_007209 [Rhizopus arrhizus]|uniref:Uncharacterized protein n=1 Tax=Rhizopus oryzae TaxID=64495 RepID=A0A9P7BMN7_RHIOR|nr:hypothetical protein G6F23_010694 [Rhizopus arrhizus]KAG1408288.1 hypothetical protein G6F58_009511 [Rhizopus delemar]KAG0755910.1 hypothetical protein G6F24_011512 [Rhizopus arrhizus]KAG0788247.1 hypothetical protein G6F22_007064 [Rhizopus arrhizus]KAG0790604.1 hypothetical protein G6F21_005685 [Rhizopus arrhizus]